jgi:integrase
MTNNTSMTGIINDYVAERQGFRKFTPITARATRYMLNQWADYIGDNWRTPTRGELNAWVTGCPSAEGCHRRRSCISAFYKWCVNEAELLDRDPTIKVSKVERGKALPKPIPQRDFLRALQTAGTNDYNAIILGRLAGLRACEIAAVHTDNIDGDHLRVDGKGRKQRRVPMHPEVKRIVLAANGFVFPANTKLGHVQPQTISQRLSRALPGRWTAHSLRHAFATQLYEETRNLKAVAEMLGHSSTKVTERYVKTEHEGAADAIRAMRITGGDDDGQAGALVAA